MQTITIDGLQYNAVNAPSGAKRFFLVGPDASVYGFETEAQRWGMVDYLRTTLEDAKSARPVASRISQHDAIMAELEAQYGPDHKSVAQRLAHRNQEGK
jgi:hypothetical protein